MTKPKLRLQRRRGVLLLVVLSILVMFVLLALTYVTVAGHYRAVTEAVTRVESTGDNPLNELDAVFSQLLRDTTNPDSVLQGESLLGDRIGFDGFTGRLTAADYARNTNQQFVDLTFNPNPLFLRDLFGNNYTPSSIENHYAGLELTIIDGPASGAAARIVGYLSPASPPNRRTLRVMFLPDMNDRMVVPAIDLVPGTQFLVNGRSFNGTGIGYNNATGKLDAVDGNMYPYALLMNPTTAPEILRVTGNPAPGEGGPDEGYDAPDFQNKFLGVMPSESTAQGSNGGLFQSNTIQEVPIPSFHRPALINYWYSRLFNDGAIQSAISDETERWRAIVQPYGIDGVRGTGDDPSASAAIKDQIADLKRKIFMRPTPEDHPYFDGGNQSSREWPTSSGTALTWSWDVYGPWDVDNDGDGVPDSVWINPGFADKSTPDGRQYRTMAAVMCIDLDGRLNLNLHGQSIDPNTTGATTNDKTLAGGGDTRPKKEVPPGGGYGPGEINLKMGLTKIVDIKQIQQLFEGESERSIPGRYGKIPSGVVLIKPQPGDDRTNVFDVVVDKAFFEHPDNYWDFSKPSAFGSPPDLHGLVGFGLNVYGQPIYRSMEPSDKFNPKRRTVYEQDTSLSGPRGALGVSARDAAFSVAEMERILRQYDNDAHQLEPRLYQLAPGLMAHRSEITTENFDLPTPNVSTTDDLRRNHNLRFPETVMDLLAARLRVGGVTEININDELRKMISPDLMMGLHMNVNRPWGNALDDNGNLVVDEHGTAAFQLEAGMLEQVYGVPFDHDNDGLTAPGTERDAYLARHLFARHLYVLLMTLKDSDVNIDFDVNRELPLAIDPNGGGFLESDKETAFGLAQWAINVVDFRDADSIMTAFEFDINPFNGWNVNGDPATDGASDGIDNDNDGMTDEADEADNPNERFLVWGCERPELLITETLAFHDHRTKDTDKEEPEDPGQKGAYANQPNPPGVEDDEEFDQEKRPRGACFIELYNPWAGDARFPAEFYYDHDGSQEWAGGVMLNKVVPGDNNRTPIWRLLIVKGDGMSKDPDVSGEPIDPVDIERSVYFTPGGESRNTIRNLLNDGADVKYVRSSRADPIRPGGFAVIGSAGDDMAGGAYTTYLGDPNSPSPPQRIVLQPNAPNDTVVVARDNDPSNPSVNWSVEGRPVAIVINQDVSGQTQRFSVSEPTDDTYENGWDPVAKLYNPVHDWPLDAEREDLGVEDVDALLRNGTLDAFRVVHLQRLANPLLPYDANTNPYLTIDSAPINLQVFNSEEPSDDDAYETHQVHNRFVTLQRGDFDPYGANNLWRSEILRVWRSEDLAPGNGVLVPDYNQRGPKALLPSDYDAAGTNNFDLELMHTLGFLNRMYGPPGAEPESPSKPYPWLTWLNRPFVNQYELLHVPKTRSSRLLPLFTMARKNVDPFDMEASDEGKPDINPFDPSVDFADFSSFGHLLNFFQSDDPNNPTDDPNNRGSRLFRLFEYTRVPSRFVNTAFELNPARFDGGNNLTNPNDGRWRFHPPFNHISKYRVPGLLNINTIFTRNIWEAVLDQHGLDQGQYDFDKYAASRRGYGTPTNRMFTLDPNWPTFFGNPFRPPHAAQMVPLDSMEKSEISVTLMRPSGSDANISNLDLLLQDSRTNDHNNTDRNAFFRYQNMQRLGNLVTTRSNVFAIWITVGYFELVPMDDPITGQSKLTLGPELGTDTGDINRYRAFYVVDRSIPVAFQPGKNHNVDRAVLLRRYIE